MANYNYVSVQGVDVTDYVQSYKVKVTADRTGKDTCNINLNKDVFSVLDDVQDNYEIIIRRGISSSDYKTVFRGLIDDVRSEYATLIIEAEGKIVLLEKSLVNQVFDSSTGSEAGKISSIANTIITDTGLSASVEDSGTLSIREKLILRDDTRLQALKELSRSIRYNFFYDYEADKVVFTSRDYDSSGVSLSVDQGCFFELPEWGTNYSTIHNVVVLSGAENLVGITEWFSGDNSTATFSLSNKPRSVKIVYSGSANFQSTTPSNSDIQVGGQLFDGAESIDYYYEEEKKSITFVSGSIPNNAASNNVQVEYLYAEDLPVKVKDQDSINKYADLGLGKNGNGEFEIKLNTEGVVTVSDAELMAREILNEYKDGKQETVLDLFADYSLYPDLLSIKPGVSVFVSDATSQIPVNKNFFINSVEYFYPEPRIRVGVGDKTTSIEDFLESTQERLKKLEEKNKNNENVLEIKQVEQVVEFYGYSDVYADSAEESVMYWDDDFLGYFAEGLELSNSSDLQCYFDFKDLVQGESYSSITDAQAVSMSLPNGCLMGYGLEFNGTSHYALLPGLFSTQVFSVGVGFTADRYDAYMPILFKQNCFKLELVSGELVFTVYTVDGSFSCSYDVTHNFLGTNRVTLIKRTSSVELWVNGELRASTNTTSNISSAGLSSSLILCNDSGSAYFDGSIHWLSVLDVAASQSDAVKDQRSVVYGDDTDSSGDTLIRRVHINDVYFEDFLDDDLVDTSKTTCTVNTTSQSLSFTSSQVFVSKILFLNAEVYDSVLFSLGNSTRTNQGALTFYACADGDDETWEEISSGVTHRFVTKNNKGVKIKIARTGSGATSVIDCRPSTNPTPISVRVFKD